MPVFICGAILDVSVRMMRCGKTAGYKKQQDYIS